jgi:DNA polymerase-3 subunit gamma/tau
MRDALSLLDQCIAFHLGETLTYENVLEVLGAVDTEIFSRLMRQILDKNITGVIATLDELVNEGRELGQLVNDFTWYLRNLLLLQSSDNMEEVLDMSAENLASLKEEAGMIEPEALVRYIRIFSELGNQIRYATQKRILIEIALIKLCRPEMEKDYSSLIDRIESLERKLENGIPVQMASTAGNAGGMGISAGGEGAAQAVQMAELPKAIPEDIQNVVRHWRSVISEIGGISKTYLNKAVPSLGNSGDLLLVFDDPNAYEYLYGNKADCLDTLKQMIANRIGKEVEINVHKNESGKRAEEAFPDLRNLIQFDIEEENI